MDRIEAHAPRGALSRGRRQNTSGCSEIRRAPLCCGITSLTLTALLLFAHPPSSYPQSSPLIFRDVTSASGITRVGQSWSVAWGDVNGDALPDLYLSNHGSPDPLYLNAGTGPRFTKAPSSVLYWTFADAHGAAWADFDNDGDQDLLQLIGAARGSGNKSNRLWVNQGGTLTEQAAERGLQDPYGRGRMPLWFDWDRNGSLDALAVNAERAEGPTTLFANNANYFQKTGVVTFSRFTRHAVLGSLQPGKLHMLLSGEPYPALVIDANQMSPWPVPNQISALGIPQTVDIVADTVLFDANGDGIDDILAIKGDLPSDAEIANGKLRSFIKIDDVGGRRGFRFSASQPINVAVTPFNSTWWSQSDIYIGRGGRHPDAGAFTLSTSDSSVDGLLEPVASSGIYIGYDRAAGLWDVHVDAKGYEEAIFVITGGTLGNLQTVGFNRFKAAQRHTLLVSGGGRYTDASSAYGFNDLAAVSNCFSATAADFDNDGDLDIFAACSGPLGRQDVSNQMFRNTGAGRFAVVASAAGISRQINGIADGAAAADFDLDGFVDLAVTNGQSQRPLNFGPSQLFRNASRQSGNGNHWLEVDLHGMKSNRDGVGARVVVNSGGRTQYRLQRNGIHNAAQDHARLHFGLGASTYVDSVQVRWPSGTWQTINSVAADRILRVVEGRPYSVPYALKPAAQAFGQVPVSGSVMRSFTVTNRNSARLPIARIRTIGLDAAQFATAHGCGDGLPAGASCTVKVTFRPTTAGGKSAQLFVLAGDKYIELGKLSGTGI